MSRKVSILKFMTPKNQNFFRAPRLDGKVEIVVTMKQDVFMENVEYDLYIVDITIQCKTIVLS